MHININATLLIQMFHFCIAYYLLRTYLLKPAISVRAQENARINEALELISQRQQSIEQTVYEQHQLWHSCNNYYTAHKPMIIENFFVRDIATESPHIEISPKEKEKAIAIATDLIHKTIGERL